MVSGDCPSFPVVQMKIKARPGEFYFKALLKNRRMMDKDFSGNYGWILSQEYFKDAEEVANLYPERSFLWPAEEIEPNCIYVPSKEEMEEDI